MGYIGLITWQDAWDNEKLRREAIDCATICRFGLKVLDDALVGILKNDLIVVGADSGVGKSELALDIAFYNASMGKKIALYYIEGGDEEAIARIKWKMIRKLYYLRGHKGLDMNYRNWRMNQIKDPLIKSLEDDCKIELEALLKDRLHLYSIGRDFTIKDLENSLGYFANWKVKDHYQEYNLECDLLIIDHLQYFTLMNPKNELQEMTNILKVVKEITEKHHIPALIISHLRKKDKDRGLPGAEDFYGTSNIAKIASQAITISPCYQERTHSSNKYPTFFRFVKSRTGLKQNYAAVCNFDIHEQKYEKEYLIYHLKGNFPEDIELPYHEWPDWARKK